MPETHTHRNAHGTDSRPRGHAERALLRHRPTRLTDPDKDMKRINTRSRQKRHPEEPLGSPVPRPPRRACFPDPREAGPARWLAGWACGPAGPARPAGSGEVGGGEDDGGAARPDPRPAIPGPGATRAACAQCTRSPGRRAAAPRKAAPRTRPESSSRSSRRCRGEGGGTGVAILQRRRRGSMAPRGRGLGTGSGRRVGGGGGGGGGGVGGGRGGRGRGGGGRGKEAAAALTLRQRIRDGG